VQNRAYVALSEDDEVAVCDVAASTELKRIRLSAGDAPRELLLSADRRTLITANSGSNTVSLIDANSALETARINVGEQPTALVADRKTPRVYVFNARSNNISVVDTASRAVVSTLPFEGPPLRGQLDKQGTHLYVASPLSNDLLVYSLPDFAQAKRVHIGLGTTALKVDPATDLLYVAQADGRLALYDPFALIPVDFIDLPGVASWLAIDGAENSLLALMPERRSVAVINLATKELLGELDVGQDPRVLALYGERN
jgi:YVTN family beta-propeller protein